MFFFNCLTKFMIMFETVTKIMFVIEFFFFNLYCCP